MLLQGLSQSILLCLLQIANRRWHEPHPLQRELSFGKVKSLIESNSFHVYQDLVEQRFLCSYLQQQDG